eukprot:TRINITY_DN96105_c0_g1_i1.p1 TRINITY_DN96105_c0_g1~~TRINITY_DN96105_c0_g1_i1.p1  ORF type:complete len:193 (-),score=29.72 TRINITY_DN96105_c0_g1_i1:43-621(-)
MAEVSISSDAREICEGTSSQHLDLEASVPVRKRKGSSGPLQGNSQRLLSWLQGEDLASRTSSFEGNLVVAIFCTLFAGFAFFAVQTCFFSGSCAAQQDRLMRLNIQVDRLHHDIAKLQPKLRPVQGSDGTASSKPKSLIEKLSPARASAGKALKKHSKKHSKKGASDTRANLRGQAKNDPNAATARNEDVFT